MRIVRPSVLLGVLRAVAAIGAGVVLVATPTVSSAPRLLASALVMGGTFTPTPSRAEVDRNVADFINPTLGLNLTGADTAVVSYPASGGVVPGSPTINESVRIGVENLDAALTAHGATEPVVAFGFSQSAVVTMIEKARLAERRAAGEPVPDVTFVGIGVGNRPNGGITTRLRGLTIPIVDFTMNGPAPTDPVNGFRTVDIAREYDGLADLPLYPVNVLADLNAVLGVLFVHARYDEVSLDPTSPKYLPGTVVQQFGDTTYYQIPTPDLPLFDIARIVGVPEQLIDIVEPATKVIVDAGYDRTIPFGEPTPIRALPTVNPVDFAAKLVAAVGEGAVNAIKVVKPKPATSTPDADPTPAATISDDGSGAAADRNATAATPGQPKRTATPDTPSETRESSTSSTSSATEPDSTTKRESKRANATPHPPGTPDDADAPDDKRTADKRAGDTRRSDTDADKGADE